jgi:hypothetical protein
MTTKNKKYTWEEVQQLCQLSDELISMAKELKLRPAELVKSLEMSKEPGNLSVENWIQQQHQKLSKSEPTTKAVKSNIAKFPTPKKSGKKDLVEKTLDRIRELTLKIEDTEEDLPTELWDLVEWMVEEKAEKLIREMMVKEELPSAGLFALDFILKDIGYRLPASLPIKNAKGKVKMQEFELIPFAILLLLPIPEEKLSNIPTTLPKSVEKLSRDKILRKALQLDDRPTLLLDEHLYHIDHNEWIEESSVVKYLENYCDYTTQTITKLPPLTEDYKRPSVSSRNQNIEALNQFCLVMRVLCGVVIAADEDSLEIEEQLFEHADEEENEKALEKREKAWKKLEECIVKEFKEHDIDLSTGLFVNPVAIELWDVPQVSMSLGRMLPLQIELHNAIVQLTSENSEDELFSPSLYISQHGENDTVEQLRIAAYGDPAQPAFFRYVWEIDDEMDDPEDVASAIMAIATELEAEVVFVEGLLPKDTCPDCGEPLFYGPGEDKEAVIHSHEEYIN